MSLQHGNIYSFPLVSRRAANFLRVSFFFSSFLPWRYPFFWYVILIFTSLSSSSPFWDVRIQCSSFVGSFEYLQPSHEYEKSKYDIDHTYIAYWLYIMYIWKVSTKMKAVIFQEMMQLVWKATTLEGAKVINRSTCIFDKITRSCSRCAQAM